MKENRFPVDILAVKEYGVDKWRDEFFWPVSDKEYIKLATAIEESFKNRINNATEDMADLLLVQCALCIEYRHFLHAIKVIDEVQKRGKTVLCSDISLWYREIAQGNLGDIGTSEVNNTRRGIARRLRSEAAKFLKNSAYNLSPAVLINLKNAKIAETYSAITPTMREYVKINPHILHLTSEENWISPTAACEIPDGLKEKIDITSGEITAELRSIADSNNIPLADKHADYLRRKTKSALLEAARILHLAKAKIGKRKIRLFASGFGDPFPQALYIAIRKRGGSITGFGHGGNIGLYDVPTPSFLEYALSDEFVAYTQKSAELFERTRNNFVPIRGNRTEIKSCESSQFLKVRQRYRNTPLPKKIKRVMIIGYPHNQWRNPHASANFSLMQLDLEIKLADILKKSGYEVFYKAHPDRTEEIKGVFEGRATVMAGHIQNQLNAVDAFLFGNIRTTAFPFALCTNRPIIGFRVKDEVYKPFPDAMELLNKRCNFVEAEFDKRNRLVFDEGRLQALLLQDIKAPNNEFLKKYYFPK